MRKVIFFVVSLFFISSCNEKNENKRLSDDPIYLDASQPVDKRVDDLMQRMILEEKVGQMCQYVGLKELSKIGDDKDTIIPDDNDNIAFYKGFKIKDIINLVKEGKVSSFLKVLGPREINYLQSLADSSRLRIPLLIATDAIHGHGMFPKGATIFPTAIGLASTFDTTYAAQLAQVTATEMRASGYFWTFSPNIDIARDARWGRVGETFGEDPLLVGLMGEAMIKAYQGDDFSGTNHVLSCAKHLAAGGEPVNGLNISPMDVSIRNFKEIFLPPFERAAKAGAFTFMTAHNEINGVPCHASKYLMTDILRDELNFKGFVVSDWMDIERLHEVHKVAQTPEDASLISVNAGMDMHMHGPYFYDHIIEGVKKEEIKIERINQAVRSILYAKFQLGLFDENRYVDENLYKKVILNDEHQKIAYQVAQHSIVLLKNEERMLPLSKKMKRIFVTGPNANDQSILGDWAKAQDDSILVTVLEGIQEKVSAKTNVDYFDCGTIRSLSQKEIKEAARKAKRAEIAVVVVGENSLRHKRGGRTCGENVATTDLNLPGNQLDLIKAIHETGTPVVVVLVNGRPNSVVWCSENVPAIIEAWEPGMFGGRAIADVLFGDFNPCGKLPITIPRSAGHLQCIYNHRPSQYVRGYGFAKKTPLYEFGYGLSFTTFEYKNLTLSKQIKKGADVTFSVDVENTGDRAGTEIVLAFVNDMYSSVTTPVKELKAFRKVTLEAGETKTLNFTITADQLALWNLYMERVVEPGLFELIVGNLKEEFVIGM